MAVTRPALRYGDSPARGRLLAMLIGGAVVALLVVWAVWVAIGVSRQDVRWSDSIAQPLRDGSVQVTFQVTMKPGLTAVCSVEALSENFAQVGLVDVTVGPSRQDTITVRAHVPTSERAVSGDVKDCAAR